MATCTQVDGSSKVVSFGGEKQLGAHHGYDVLSVRSICSNLVIDGSRYVCSQFVQLPLAGGVWGYRVLQVQGSCSMFQNPT